MKTWKEILKENGQTDEQIKAIETTLGTSGALFDSIITGAEAKNAEAARTLQQATEKETKINEFWNKTATPQINEAFSKVATLEAQAAFYKTQADKAKESGFIPSDAPGYTPPANPNPAATPGFVPNANPVPGSPQYVTAEQAASYSANAMYISNEHLRLFGKPLSGDEIVGLLTEANTTKTKAVDVWRNKFKVPERIQELAATDAKAHEDKIRTDERDKVTREYHEKYGNDETRPRVASHFPKYAERTTAGAPDRKAWAKPDAKEKFKQKIHEQVRKETGSVN